MSHNYRWTFLFPALFSVQRLENNAVGARFSGIHCLSVVGPPLNLLKKEQDRGIYNPAFERSAPKNAMKPLHVFQSSNLSGSQLFCALKNSFSRSLQLSFVRSFDTREMPLRGGFHLDLFEVLLARLLELSGRTASFRSFSFRSAFCLCFRLIEVQEKARSVDRIFFCLYHVFKENDFVSCAVDIFS